MSLFLVTQIFLQSLEEKSTHTSHLTLFLYEDFKVLVNDCDGQQNTSSGSNRSHEVGSDGECSDTEATEGGSGGNVTVELVNHGSLSVTTHHHLLVTELLGDLK